VIQAQITVFSVFANLLASDFIKNGLKLKTFPFIQVKGNFRNAILIPESGWESFRNVLDEYVKQTKDD
jgi:hypothetical protein